MSQKHFTVAFTGTRKGMTDAQKSTVLRLLESLAPDTAFNGACRGADVDFNRLCIESGIKYVDFFPASGVRKEDQCLDICLNDIKNSGICSLTHAEDNPLVRNKDMVTWSDILIACPGEMDEVLRSGTWATIREGIRQKKVIIVYPDGSDAKQLDRYFKNLRKNRAVRRYEAVTNLTEWME